MKIKYLSFLPPYSNSMLSTRQLLQQQQQQQQQFPTHIANTPKCEWSWGTDRHIGQ